MAELTFDDLPETLFELRVYPYTKQAFAMTHANGGKMCRFECDQERRLSKIETVHWYEAIAPFREGLEKYEMFGQVAKREIADKMSDAFESNLKPERDQLSNMLRSVVEAAALN